jgi:hypothetical protein
MTSRRARLPARLPGWSLLLALGVAYAGTGATAQPAKVEARDGIVFGMTIEEVLRVRPDGKRAPCEQNEAIACVHYGTYVLDMPARAIVKFDGTPMGVGTVELTLSAPFNALACEDVSTRLARLLETTYGGQPSVQRQFASWDTPAGGSVTHARFCTGNQAGNNHLIYLPKKFGRLR